MEKSIVAYSMGNTKEFFYAVSSSSEEKANFAGWIYDMPMTLSHGEQPRI